MKTITFAILAVAVALAAPVNGNTPSLAAYEAAVDEQVANGTGPFADGLRDCMRRMKDGQKERSCSIWPAPQDTTLGKMVPPSYHPYLAIIQSDMRWGSKVNWSTPVRKGQIVALSLRVVTSNNR